MKRPVILKPQIQSTQITEATEVTSNDNAQNKSRNKDDLDEITLSKAVQGTQSK